MRTVLTLAALVLGLALIAQGFLSDPRDRGSTAPDAPATKGDAAMPDADARIEPNDRLDPNDRLELSEAEWKERLTPEQYRITREAGTERAFTGEYWDVKTAGTYKCRCCDLPLFRSDAKFDSGCGWPSFFEPLDGFHVTQHEDLTYGMRRVEVRCKRCDAHLGHVFPDGPEPTGQRYCINSASIELEADEIREPDGE